jgi:hypothetical protein
MVIFIKQRKYDEDAKINFILNIRGIAKQMINIEANRYIYYEDGKVNNNIEKDERCYNNYEYKNVDFTITPNCGRVILYLGREYLDLGFSDRDVINNIKSGLSGIKEISYTKNPRPFTDLTTHHTLLQRIDNDDILPITREVFPGSYRHDTKSFRHIQKYTNKIVDRNANKEFYSLFSQDICFAWDIVIVDSDVTGRIIKKNFEISELSNIIPSSVKLYESITTIIFDALNMFSVQENTKQLDYPHIYQLNMFSESRIELQTINVHEKSGLTYEIFSLFTEQKEFEMNPLRRLYNFSGEIGFSDIKNQVIPVDKSRNWKGQLQKYYNCDPNSEYYGRFRYNVCFVSKVPLHDDFYVIKLEHKRDSEEESDSEKLKFICISPVVFHMMNTLAGESMTLITSLYGLNFNINSMYICKSLVTFGKTLKMIPENKVNLVKKKIMYCMEKYGCFPISNVFIVPSLTERLIYVGVKNLNDSHIYRYNNTGTLLFRINNIRGDVYHDKFNIIN